MNHEQFIRKINTELQSENEKLKDDAFRLRKENEKLREARQVCEQIANMDPATDGQMMHSRAVRVIVR